MDSGYCTQRREENVTIVNGYCNKLSFDVEMLVSLPRQAAWRNLATKQPLSASIEQHCQILSNISCMPGQNKI